MNTMPKAIPIPPNAMPPPKPQNEIPQAVAEAEIDLLGIKVRVYQLSDGREVIDANDFHRLLIAMQNNPNLKVPG